MNRVLWRWGVARALMAFAIAGMAQAAALHGSDTANRSGASVRTNILDDPGFDLGSGAWRFVPWNEDADTLPVFDEQIHQSGRRSLHFSGPGQGESVESRLYALASGQPYTLSFWIRGPAVGKTDAPVCTVYLITAAWKLQPFSVKQAEIGPNWRRFSFSWRPPAYDDPYGASVYVRFDAMSELWLDSLQLEAGTAATDYQGGPQIGIETALVDGIAARGLGRIVLRAERPTAALAVAQLSARDTRGSELWTQRVDLGTVGPAGVTVPVDIRYPRLGVTELHTELLDEDGWRLAVANLRIAVMDPAAVRPNPLVGIDNYPMLYNAARLRDRERWASLLGSGCTRVFLACYSGTRRKLVEDGPDYLAIAADLLSPVMQQGRPVTMCFDPARGSPLNLERMQRENHGPAAADEPAAIAALAARAGRIATALRGKIACYEILNEPNIWTISGVQVMPADRLARIIAGVAPTIRAAAPGVRIAANINGIDLPYVEALLKAPDSAAVDVLTVHPYRATPEMPPLYEDMRKLRALVERLRPGLPIVATEQYYLSREDGFSNGEYNRNYAASRETDQAGRTIQAALHHLAAETSPYVFFQPDDNLYRQGPEGVHWFFAATMLRQLSQRLNGLESGTAIEVHPVCRAFLYRLKDGGRVVAAMAREFGAHGRLVVPVGCSASDCDGNPITTSEAVIDHLPTWLSFPAGTSDTTIAQALRQAEWRGFDFPLVVQASDGRGALAITVANRGTRPAGGLVEIAAAPPGWPTGRIEIPLLAPGAKHQATLPGLPKALAWDAESVLHWRLTSDGEVAMGAGRVPTMHIPRIGADWPGSAWIVLDDRHLSRDFSDGKLPHHGPADLSARVALGWDSDGLKFVAEVRDDVVFRGTQPDELLWMVDSLQLYVDPTDAAQEGRRGFDRGNACWLFGAALDGSTAAILTHNPGDRYLGAANAETGRDPAIPATWARRADGWTLSVRLPARALPGLKLQAGSRFGWSVLINDNDGSGRKPGLTLGPAGSEPYEQPWLWRCAVLAD